MSSEVVVNLPEEIRKLLERAMVYEKFPKEAIAEVSNFDIKKLYQMFDLLDGNEEFYELKKAIKRTGIWLGFDIRSIFYGEVEEFPSNCKAKIKGCEKCDLFEYWDEKDGRMRIMRELIMKSMNKPLTGSRGRKVNE